VRQGNGDAAKSLVERMERQDILPPPLPLLLYAYSGYTEAKVLYKVIMNRHRTYNVTLRGVREPLV
jgi:hypothetical protein